MAFLVCSPRCDLIGSDVSLNLFKQHLSLIGISQRSVLLAGADSSEQHQRKWENPPVLPFDENARPFFSERQEPGEQEVVQFPHIDPDLNRQNLPLVPPNLNVIGIHGTPDLQGG